MVLGAAGLIGAGLVSGLAQAGVAVTAVARRFPPGRTAASGAQAVVAQIVDLDAGGLAALIAAHRPDVVVNAVGVLQDSAAGTTLGVHRDFVARLLAALAARPEPPLLVHFSVPGSAADDRTGFATSKRAAEALIAASGLPHAVLRPGFVLAGNAYGGSALMRGLAALPLALPAALAGRPFAAVDMSDITATVLHLVERRQSGARHLAETWDLVETDPGTVGDVLEALRERLGGPKPAMPLPSWLLRLGALAGDLASQLGWAPPVRSTALAEMRRGVTGDPGAWLAATGLSPKPLAAMLAGPASVEERWFARLYLLKPLVLGGLSLFWIVSGLVAMTVGFGAATALVAAQGLPGPVAQAFTLATSLADIAVGVAIAVRRWAGWGLLSGIGLTLAYIAGAAVLMPFLFADPLGAMVKAFPVLLLMLVAWAMLPSR